ncbi:hypothetical protein ACH4UR_25090 [Streptomyces lydicus]
MPRTTRIRVLAESWETPTDTRTDDWAITPIQSLTDNPQNIPTQSRR